LAQREANESNFSQVLSKSILQVPAVGVERAGDTGRLKEKGRLRDENISAAEGVSHLCRARLGERLHCE
jgi:hypothetical protein